MEPTFSTRPGISDTAESHTYTNYTPPADSDPAPSPESGKHASHAGHGSHHWMHLLMCAPMVLVVGFLVLTGRAGGGSIFYALSCLGMMAVMMVLMNRSSGGGGSNSPTQGHRH